MYTVCPGGVRTPMWEAMPFFRDLVAQQGSVDAAYAALAAGRPLVIDADALNLMAASGLAFPAGSIMTPHPGEAARLLKCAASDIQNDRLGALRKRSRHGLAHLQETHFARHIHGHDDAQGERAPHGCIDGGVDALGARLA